MDTTKCNLDTLIENVQKHIFKFNYYMYKITDEYLFISKTRLSIAEINKKRCELKEEDYHYYW